jgi:hypothetical protein
MTPKLVAHYIQTVQTRVLPLESTGLAVGFLLAGSRVEVTWDTISVRLIDAHLWIWGRIVFASNCIATCLLVRGP